MFLKHLKKAVSEQVKNQKTVKQIEQAFNEAEISNAAFELKKQQILQEMRNGTRRSCGKLPL
ncbi:hypothetical protein LVJ85_08330 [Neisseria sp. Dent CA1/247]|uniref:hypothetical protein n=1 Tax=Neisseria sp. Dent CA1/247 TaxID=2912675 RepID=UPI001FD0F4D0|nr:hypothetical protein [Neisseria sp. Dent CA1/247]UOO76054.1 hypothetical protein LVJ85_08330 [Neisseria sp. Dent CA1/247]